MTSGVDKTGDESSIIAIDPPSSLIQRLGKINDGRKVIDIPETKKVADEFLATYKIMPS